MKKLESLYFDNRYSQLPEPFYSRQAPTPFSHHYLVSVNHAAAKLIDLDADELQRQEFIDYMSGSRPFANSEPVAMCYSGHQFGHYVPRLGDGRAILLGQVRNKANQLWDLHLKGGGTTPYSRQGDGRAVLRSTIREYLCSEAMHSLGIPTSRALCIIGSDDEVYRESIETGAMLVRMAPSHVRFGSFEYFYYNNQFEHLRQLADYIIDEHYPEIAHEQDKYLLLLRTVTTLTAQMIAQWQAVGFSHGVMNSDNMSILGITLDYGPFGFVDTYQPGFICNHSDHHGRYAFNQQPNIGLFNLSCLAQALLPILAQEPEAAVESAKEELGHYQPQFTQYYAKLMRAKLGLLDAHEDDQQLCADLLRLMENHVDYTIAFRALAQFDQASEAKNTVIRDMFLDRDGFDLWSKHYKLRLELENSENAERQQRMLQSNPKYILRNYLAESAIRRANEEKDYSEIDRLLKLLSRPFDEQPEMETYAAPPPDWAQKIEVSCSS